MAIVIQSTSINSCWGCDIWSDPKSYNRYYVYFCVPWILEVDSNDLHTGTTNDCICCFCQLSIHVGTSYTGHDSCKVLWAVWPCCCICRWVLPLHHHPQWYITWYLVVKVGMLIWQVGTKRNNSKVSPILLV